MIRLLPGDCRDVLATLPAESVQCCITSPPYYALRSYLDAAHPDKHREIGSEPTPDEYLATMVGVFREIRRVLRSDGTVWCNLGDSFVGGGGYCPGAPSNVAGSKQSGQKGAITSQRNNSGLAAKQLLLMPARLALALQADGWWVRSDVIWHKPNPMPESCRDRPTSSHEHVFLLTKAARYYYDVEAVREAQSEGTHERFGKDNERSTGTPKATAPGIGIKNNSSMDAALKDMVLPNGRNLRNVWTIATHALSSAFSDGSYRIASEDCAVHDRQADLARVLECDAQQDVFPFGRNPGKRSRPAELPEGAVVSIPVDRSEFPVGVTSAIGRSSQNHRMPVLSERDVIFGDIPGGHTECRALLDHSFAMFARKPASNTLRDASLDGRLSCQSVESPDRIVGIATYEPRPDGCNCYYAGTVHKRQDHFASFPPELAERCIRAGTSERGCCAACGKPWGRVTEQTRASSWDARKAAGHVGGIGGSVKLQREHQTADYDCPEGGFGWIAKYETTGWSPGCQCNAATVPCTVLDPFIGAGTTALVADRLQRDVIGIDLNTAYTRMAMDRCIADAPLLAEADLGPMPEHPEESAMGDLFAGMAAD